MTHEQILRRRIKRWTWFFIIGLVFSGVTAIPLVTELEWLTRWCGLESQTSATATNELARWLLRIREALQDTAARHPMLFYGTDWLAFGHLMIAVAFIGVLRDPVRNRWLFDFGLIACVLVIPFALSFGAMRGIPLVLLGRLPRKDRLCQCGALMQAAGADTCEWLRPDALSAAERARTLASVGVVLGDVIGIERAGQTSHLQIGHLGGPR